MDGDEVEGPRLRPRVSDTRALIIRCGVIEGASQRLPLLVAHRRIVQPQDLKQRRLHRSDRPFAIAAVEERESSEGSRRVVARDDLVPQAVPAIVSFVISGGQAAR